jgi:hypothetical protein
MMGIVARTRLHLCLSFPGHDGELVAEDKELQVLFVVGQQPIPGNPN